MSRLTRAYAALTKRDLTTDLLTFMGLPYGFGSTSLSKMQAMQLSAVYRCVEVLSNSMASVTREVQESTGKGWKAAPYLHLWDVLNVEPSATMDAFVMWKLAIVKVLLEGNAYIRIHRGYDGMPVQLRIILDSVKILQDNSGILFYVIQTGSPEIVEQSDIIHLKGFSYDGLIGVSVLTHANNTLTLYDASEKSAKNYFYGGANGGAIVQVAGRLDATRAAEIKADFVTSTEPVDGSPNGLVVTGRDMEVKPWPSIPPRDAQMLESREFTMLDICRFFGCPPEKVYYTKDSKYNTVESMQLAFSTDTVGPMFVGIEAEINRKLFMPSLRSTLRVRYDIEELLKADLDSKANYRMKMFQIGGFTIDDNREAVGKEVFGTPETSAPYVQVNMQNALKPNQNGNGSKKLNSGSEPDKTE